MVKLLALLSQTVYPGSSTTLASRGVIPSCPRASRSVPIDGVCASTLHCGEETAARDSPGRDNLFPLQFRQYNARTKIWPDLYSRASSARNTNRVQTSAFNSSRTIRPIVQWTEIQYRWTEVLRMLRLFHSPPPPPSLSLSPFQNVLQRDLFSLSLSRFTTKAK